MIPTPHAHLQLAAATHPGTGGRQNEDRYSVSAYRLGAENATPAVFAIISDGIGGHRAGEVAAEMAVETISAMVAQSDGSQPLEVLDNAIQVTSEAIAARAKDDTQRLGMGTTCTCAWVIGNQLFTASVGDSRIYLLRGKTILQLTVDHTWVQEAMEKGILKASQIRNHPNQHVIRRYLGSPKTPQADTRLRLATDESDTQSRRNQGLLLQSGDLVLLCTDGLTDLVTDDEILAAVNAPARRGQHLEAAARSLVDLANQRGGRDNTTVVLMELPGAGSPGQKKNMVWLWIVLGLAGLCLLAAVITAGAWLVHQYLLPPAATLTSFL
jgi:serine/threonine protein phosphatase PrpC